MRPLPEPRPEVATNPVDIGTQLLAEPPTGRLVVQRLGPGLVGPVDAQGPGQGRRGPLVTELVAVQPVLEPQPRVLRDRVVLEVHHQHAVALRLRPDDVVEPEHPVLDALAQRVDRGRVGEREGQHGAVAGPGLAVHGRQVRPHLVEVPTHPDQVVPAAEDGHQVGLEGERVVELSVADLVESQTADGEIGVLQRLVLGVGDQLSKPVGPAAVAALTVGVDQTLGAGVADGDVAVEGGHPPIVAQDGSPIRGHTQHEPPFRPPTHPVDVRSRRAGRRRGGRRTVPGQPVRADRRPAAARCPRSRTTPSSAPARGPGSWCWSVPLS